MSDNGKARLAFVFSSSFWCKHSLYQVPGTVYVRSMYICGTSRGFMNTSWAWTAPLFQSCDFVVVCDLGMIFA